LSETVTFGLTPWTEEWWSKRQSTV